MKGMQKNRIDRRRFLQIGGMAGAGMMLPWQGLIRRAYGQVIVQTPLGGNMIPQFVDALPSLHAIVAGASEIVLNMTEFQSQVMPSTFVPAVGTYTGTWHWGYLEQDQPGPPYPSYIGPVIVATRGTPTQVKFVNNLGNAGLSAVTAYNQAIDQTLMWADPQNGEANQCAMQAAANPGVPPPNPLCSQFYTGPVPAVPHLHGGEVPPVLDGGPDAWFTSDGQFWGHAYYSFGFAQGPAGPGNYAVYRYPNTQEAANIWFHDHALGITRLNVYAGLAGAYIITDAASTRSDLPGPMVPLVIQDRMFDINGQLFFPNVGINPEHPYWIPEFVGDTIVVNGKVWPFFSVERKRYRFLFLNGSNARAYDMSLIDRVTGIRGPRMWVIGTDGGYLDTPVLIDPNATGANKAVQKSLVIMPGERYEVIIDFNDPQWTALAGTGPVNLVLQNTAKTPFPGGAPAPKNTTGSIMQFQVAAAPPAADASYDPSTLVSLRPGGNIIRLVDRLGGSAITPAVTRRLTLNEIMGAGGPLEVVVNNTKYRGQAEGFENGIRADFTLDPSGLTDFTYYSELPVEGQTELWEIINLTADAHPIHLHLVQFQLMNRQAFDVKGYNAAYAAAFPGGVYLPAYGPPLDYYGRTAIASPPPSIAPETVLGGNPDITPHLNAKKSPPVPPLPHEQGWKDTVIMYPGEVTRIMVRWAPTDLAIDTPAAGLHFPFDPNGGHGYVWHCHIIDHEDNEMMRPDSVQLNPDAPAPASRLLKKVTDY